MATTHSLASGTYKYSIFIASAGEDAVTLPAGSTATLYNCICISADGTGLVNASASVTVKNCILKGSVADASSSADITATSSHNCFVSGATPANFGTTGNKLVAPGWMDEGGGDYQLLITSPLIGVGVNVGLLGETDYYGRVVTLPVCIGVAENALPVYNMLRITTSTPYYVISANVPYTIVSQTPTYTITPLPV